MSLHLSDGRMTLDRELFHDIAWAAGPYASTSLLRLQTLELSNQFVERDHLQQFVRERSSTLEVVRLRYVDDDWDYYNPHPNFGAFVEELWSASDGDNKEELVIDLKASYGGDDWLRSTRAMKERSLPTPWIDEVAGSGSV